MQLSQILLVILWALCLCDQELINKTKPTFFLQYYSWWSNQYNVEDIFYENKFVDQLDFEAIGIQGITNSKKGSRGPDFDLANFKYIKSLGFDALSWQIDGGTTLPPVDELKKVGLKVAPFVDVVQFVKRSMNESMLANIPDFTMRPNTQCRQYIISSLKDYFKAVPSELYARDAKGRLVIYIFFFKWEMEFSIDPYEYDKWADLLLSKMNKMIGEKPTFYVNYNSGAFLLYLLLHHREYFVPFTFVSDSPQGQFGHDSVTWNFGFDNYGVHVRDKLERAIKVDPRYITEQAWLAAATNPAAVFVYGWNEPFESSMLFPTKLWGDTKAKVAKYYIQNYEKHRAEINLPSTLIIVNDFPTWLAERYPWRQRDLANIERYYMDKAFRFYAPHADVVLTTEVTSNLLGKYDIIIDATLVKNNHTISNRILSRLSKKRLLIFEPMEFISKISIRNKFLKYFSSSNYSMENNESNNKYKVLEYGGKKHSPVVIQKNDDVYVAMKTKKGAKLARAFAALYNNTNYHDINNIYNNSIALTKSIHHMGRRVIISADEQVIKFYPYDHRSIIGQIPLPSDIIWYRPLQGVNKSIELWHAIEDFAYGKVDTILDIEPEYRDINH